MALTFQTQFFEVLRGWALAAETEIGGLQQIGATHEHGSLDGVFAFADISRPGILQERLQRRGVKTLNRAAVAGGIADQKGPGESGNNSRSRPWQNYS